MRSNRTPLSTKHGKPLRAIVLAAFATTLAIGCQPSGNAPISATALRQIAVGASTPVVKRTNVERQPIADGPRLLRDDITLHKATTTSGGSIKIARNPVDGAVFVLNQSKGIYRISLDGSATPTIVATSDSITAGMLAGMTFGPDGTLFVVANKTVGKNQTQAVIRKGTATTGGFTWSTLAETAPYPLSGTPFDHLFNGVVVSNDGQWLFANSGSRTDHGEVEDNQGAFPNTRDVPLTAKIFRIPTNAVDLTLPNDDELLLSQGLVFARGTRNAYDLEVAPNGDLFAVDNGPDADYPDELNWLQAGQHYGFPWRFGQQGNPQQFAGYVSSKDVHLQPDFTAVRTGTYHDDPSFPLAPNTMIGPIMNRGPDAAQYRGPDGAAHNATSEGSALATFTPHRSPLGLAFAMDATLPADLRGTNDALSLFVLSYGAAGGTLSDTGQDLLHLTLTKHDTTYEAATTQIARGFNKPIDALMLENRLYVLEYGGAGTVWELTFR